MSVTNAEHHVQAIIDLLEAATDSEWTPTTTPNVRRYWDDAQSERGPGADQPAILYVWSPTGTPLEQFSRDATQYDKTDTVEIQAWSFDATESRQLQTDVTRILSKFLDDNKDNTPYNTVRPTGQEDFREQKPARTTDHYVMSVEVDTRGLSPTRDIDATAFELTFDGPFA
jgi:hypothetical protein